MAGGASAQQSLAHIAEAIREKGLKATVTDVTDKMGVLSLQGPNSRKILQKVTDFNLTDSTLPLYSSSLITIKGQNGTYKIR